MLRRAGRPRRPVTATSCALPNTTDGGPRRRFLVRPSDYQLAERRATELGGELLGFYHSHPDHPARPSQYDLDHAWPTFAYIIVAVAAGRRGRHDRVVSEGRSFDVSKRAVFNHGENSHPDPAPAVHG